MIFKTVTPARAPEKLKNGKTEKSDLLKPWLGILLKEFQRRKQHF